MADGDAADGLDSKGLDVTAIVPPRDPMRGYVGGVYEEIFEHLYKPELPSKQEQAEDDGAQAEGAGGDDDAEPAEEMHVVDLSAEIEEIGAIHSGLQKDHERIADVMNHQKEMRQLAIEKDEDWAERLQKRGLTVREQFPVLPSELKSLLAMEKMQTEQTQMIVPRTMMTDAERRIAVKSGIEPMHDNLLAISKPEEPNYLQETSSIKLRTATRNIQPHLTDAQKTALVKDLGERARERPRPPPGLNAEERAKNRDIVKKMFTKINFQKNPRYDMSRGIASKGVNPFAIIPDSVIFRSYEVGSVYEIVVELRNCDRLGRRVRVLPCNNPAFALTQLQYESDTKSAPEPFTVIAPGMAAFFTVRFAPTTLHDQTEEITVATEIGNFKLPLLTRRVPPQLDFREPVNCGEILAGEQLTLTTVIANQGGEGSFRFVGRENSEEVHYETIGDNTVLICEDFRIQPARFYLETGQSIEIEICFSAKKVGHHRCPLLVESDAGETTPFTLTAICDAVRLELVRWPTFPGPVRPQILPPNVAPLSMVPWQLNWLTPGSQVGCSESQSITISNGSYLPIKVQWRLVAPPLTLLSRLSVNSQRRLTEELFETMHYWSPYEQASIGQPACPFIVQPPSATIEPFQTSKFTFSYYAYAPVGQRSTVFAYLVATDLPSGGHCLPSVSKLMEMQKDLQPDGYPKGLPLFGGAVGKLFNVRPLTDVVLDNDNASESGRQLPSHLERASCAITAVCLQGKSIAPSVACLPRVVSFAGDVLPFVSHKRELILRNTGSMPSNFRFKLTSIAPSTNSHSYDPIWVVAKHEVGPPPSAPSAPTSDLQRAADALLLSQWPPLPPSGEGEDGKPGFGAYVTVAVEPHEGTIQPGQSAKISLCIRVAKEVDLSVEIGVDLLARPGSNEPVVPTIKVPILAAVRAPQVELRRTNFLDYGVVRAYARHTAKLCVDNPSDMPVLVRLSHSPDKMDSADSTTKSAPSADLRACRSVLETRGFKKLPSYAKMKDRLMLASEENTEVGEQAGVAPPSPAFPVRSHEEVVDFFLEAVRNGHDGIYAEVPGENMLEDDLKPWVHAQGGTVDISGRRNGRGRSSANDDTTDLEKQFAIVPDSVDLIFKPACFVLWPRQQLDVEVALRTSGIQKYRAIVEASTFDSMNSQSVEVYAEVQLPRFRLSTQHAHFPVTYLKTASEPYLMQFYNDSDMPATFDWSLPLNLAAGLEVQVEPSKGELGPRKSTTLQIVACPTRVAEHAQILCHVFVQDVIQPLGLQVSAVVYGPEVDWAVVAPGVLPPPLPLKPRAPADEPCGTFPVELGKAKKGLPVVDFGEMALGETREMKLVLYNRTGIPTPFAAQVLRNPAHDPLLKGRKIGSLLDAATRMYQLSATVQKDPSTTQPAPQAFYNEPQPATQGAELSDDQADEFGDSTQTPAQIGNGTKESRNTAHRRSHKFKGNPGGSAGRSQRLRKAGDTHGRNPLAKKRLLLDDSHERQAFRTDAGAEFAKQKDMKEQGSVALKAGRGFAVKIEPNNDWLQPFSMATVTLTCYSDLPGTMHDELVLSVRQLPGHTEGGDYRIPVKVTSHGNPLYLPDQQIGLNSKVEPARLLVGTCVPAEKFITRNFKVGNNASTPMKISWKVHPKRQLNNMSKDRQLVNLRMCQQISAELPEEAEAVEAGLGEDEDAHAVADPDTEIQHEGEILRDNVDEEPPELPFNFQIWSEEPPEVKDPFAVPETGDCPVRIEPEEAILPIHGTSLFKVTMAASKATATAANHYNYVLIAEARFTDDRAKRLEDYASPSKKDNPLSMNKESTGDPFERTKISKVSKYESDHRSTEEKRHGDVQVAQLPKIEFSGEDLHDNDSDFEREAAPTGTTADGAVNSRPHAGEGALERGQHEETSFQEPDQDVVSRVVINCVGDCVLPQLTIDKRLDPSFEDSRPPDSNEDDDLADGLPMQGKCPVFKFTHSAVPLGDKPRGSPGTTLGGVHCGSQTPGVTSCLERHIPFSNLMPCNLNCRFRVKGPFQIKMISQPGCHDVKREEAKKKRRQKPGDPPPPPDPVEQLFVVPRRDTITVHVEFVPSLVPASDWTNHKATHEFHGDLVVEYPRDVSSEANQGPTPIDEQLVHLKAISRQPVCRVTVVPVAKYDPKPQAELAHHPPWAGSTPVVVEFGYVHVESSIERKREILLSNESPLMAMWKLLHVGRKRRSPHEIGNALREEEDFRALDDKDAFEFDVSSGSLKGPTKDGLVYGTNDRQVHWCALPVAQPRAPKHFDDHHYEPQRISIVFKPKRNEMYKCRFRIQVEAGLSIDFICRGCGSYDEEDDVMDFREA